MTILQDMDACFLANRPLRRGAAWLIGGNVWHAFMADVTHVYHAQGLTLEIDPKIGAPRDLYGATVRRVPKMSGWGLAEALDADEAVEHGAVSEGVDAHEQSLAE